MSLLTLNLRYKDLAGAPYTGQVVIQPTSVLQDIAGHATIGLNGVTVALASGIGSVQLPYNDSPSITTSNPALKDWCYYCIEQVTDPGGIFEPRAPFFFDLPTALGASANLSDLPRYGSRPGYGWFWGIR